MRCEKNHHTEVPQIVQIYIFCQLNIFKCYFLFLRNVQVKEAET